MLALVIDPTNFDESKYPDDAKKRAKAILDRCRGQSIGSYSEPSGFEIIRRHVAEYIQNRDDGIPSHWDDIYLCAGASQSIKAVMNLFNCQIDGKVTGIMVPRPEYPLYSTITAEYAMHQIGYYLNEDTNWDIDISELECALEKAKLHCHPRAIVIINPGNPTGQVLSYENIVNVIKFAHQNHLFILADEVYQENVYEMDSTFHSVKKVMFQMGNPYSGMELASFMSCSKGYVG